MSRYFGQILTPSIWHTLSHISVPPKVRPTSRTPTIFGSTCIHTYVITGGFVLVCGGFWPGFCLGFLSGRFCLGCLSIPLLSEYIHYNRKLNITFNVRFHVHEHY